jgi:translation elongation factor EF-G
MKLPKLNFQFKLPTVKIYGIDVVKNFLFFTFFIFLTLLSIGLIIAPTIRVFKKYQTEFYKTKSEFDVLKEHYIQKNEELKKLKKTNSKIISALNRDFDEKNFKNFASKFMNITNIKEINSTIYKNDFIKTSYMIDAIIKSPKNFYDFIDALKNYKYVIRAYFPVNFEKKEESIALSFKIEHYKIKDKNEK